MRVILLSALLTMIFCLSSLTQAKADGPISNVVDSIADSVKSMGQSVDNLFDPEKSDVRYDYPHKHRNGDDNPGLKIGHEIGKGHQKHKGKGHDKHDD